MAIKTISQFDAATPTSNDKILFEQNGEGKSSSIQNLILNTVYPVGSIYLTVSTSANGPDSPAQWLGGSWEKLPEGYALWTASSEAGNTINAGLPNIAGNLGLSYISAADVSWADNSALYLNYFDDGYYVQRTQGGHYGDISFNASRHNAMYGNSSTVQPPAYKVYAWKRVA